MQLVAVEALDFPTPQGNIISFCDAGTVSVVCLPKQPSTLQLEGVGIDITHSFTFRYDNPLGSFIIFFYYSLLYL